MKYGIRVVAAFLMLIGLAFSAAGASAQVSGDATADNTNETCISADLGGQQLQVGIADRTSAVAVNLPAGTVSIPSARATDSYPSRVNVTQLSEKYEVEFLSASGAIIAVSTPTADVPDMVEFGEWTGSLGTVELSEAAVAIRAHHRPDLPTDGSPESVRANEITLCFETTLVCGDEGVTTNPDGTPCTLSPSTPVCGDEGVTTNPDGTPCTSSPTVTTPDTTATTGEVAGPTTSEGTTTTTGEVAGPTTSEGTTTTTTGEVAGPTTSEVVSGNDPELPLTGSNTGPLVALGALMIAAGAGLALTNRQVA